MTYTELIKEQNKIKDDIISKVLKDTSYNFDDDLFKLQFLHFKDLIYGFDFDSTLSNSFEENIRKFLIGKNFTFFTQMYNLKKKYKDENTSLLVKKLETKFDTFNQSYLKTESNYVNSKLVSANTFIEAEKKKENNLRYIATTDGKTRDWHIVLNDLVRPVSDPVWNVITPVVDFNCRCRVVITNKDITTITDSQQSAINKIKRRNGKYGFVSNAARFKEFFNDDNKYIKEYNKNTK